MKKTATAAEREGFMMEIEACKKVCEERGLDLRIRPYEE